MADGTRQMAEATWQMAQGTWQMAQGKKNSIRKPHYTGVRSEDFSPLTVGAEALTTNMLLLRVINRTVSTNIDKYPVMPF
jgi:hypothetical protein